MIDNNAIAAPVRKINAKVEVFTTSTNSKKDTNVVRLDGCKVGEALTVEVAANTEVSVYGKNFYNPELKLTDNYLMTNGKATSSTGYKCVLDFIPVTHLQGKTITLNHPVAEKSTTTNARAFVFYTADNESSVISGANTRNGTYTVPTTANYMRFTIPNNYAEADIQIELGDTVTELEDYVTPTVSTADESGIAVVNSLSTTATICATGNVTVSYSVKTATTYRNTDRINAITLDRTGENKFFGFGVCHRANLKLMNTDNECNIAARDEFDIYFNDCLTSPRMRVTEVHRDEITNELSVTAYDQLYFAIDHTVAELNLTAPYTLRDLVNRICEYLGITAFITEENAQWFELNYEEGANFDGAETLREVLNAIAEITFSTYFISQDGLCFKRLEQLENADYTIGKDRYFSLKNNDNRRLAAICSATDLGDNIIAESNLTGTTQYIRNNPLLELREDITTILENGLAILGGLTINQFECEWRGDYSISPCDSIALVAKDDTKFYSYLVNDTIDYNGGFKQKSFWKFEDAETVHDNPTTLGEALKETYAKVDKANKQIDIVVSEVGANASNISSIQMNTDSISASVSAMDTKLNDSIENTNASIAELTTKVNATLTPEAVRVEIQNELNNGVEKVATIKGYTFDNEGLKIASSESDISTTITEDGMTVKVGSSDRLVANNEGVTAQDLHASTFLIVGKYSRFENYGSQRRTACYWIG